MACLSNWLVRSCLILVLLLGTVACGASVPRTVVQDALQFEIAHAKESANTLVGVELLERWSQLRSVNVQAQSSVTVPAEAETYPGIEVRGTYTLDIRTPDRKSRYTRTEPFALTLVHVVEPEAEIDRWLLAQPPNITPNSKERDWTLVDVVSAPEVSPSSTVTPEPNNPALPPQLSPQETSDISGVFETLTEHEIG